MRLPAFLLALLLALCAGPAAAAAPASMHGLPLMQRFDRDALPSANFTIDSVVAVDAHGTPFVTAGEGVMVYRGGEWTTVELPRKTAANALFAASDGKLYVGGTGLFGELRTLPDGSFRFIDLLPKFAQGDKPASIGYVSSIVETPRGVYFLADTDLFLLARDGGARRWALPTDTRQVLFAVGDAVYARISGVGLCRVEDGKAVPVAGGNAFAQLPFTAIWPWRDGLLIPGFDGFHFADANGVRRLPGDADAAFAAHQPYLSTRLPDGSILLGSFDGVLMRFSPELRLLDGFSLGLGALVNAAPDRDGGLWIAGENGLARLRLPSPWTVYDQRHGLDNLVFDSAWHDGALWAGSYDVRRATPAQGGAAPRFAAQHWVQNDLEAYALESTRAGLLIGQRTGVLVVEPGAKTPRRLLEQVENNSGVESLWRARTDPDHVLGLGGPLSGNRRAVWLALRDGRWQLAAQWDSGIGQPSGVHASAPGEFWIGDRRGGAWRWRIDPGSGALRERRHFGAPDGLRTDRDLGSHVFALDGALYAISGTRVQTLQGERFVDARLPALPGLERPWELRADDNALGTFVWTSRQLWRRLPGQADFQPLHVSNSRAPNYRSLKLDGDGILRIAAGNTLLQFDPAIAEPALPPLRAGLVRIERRPPDAPPSLLPLLPSDAAPVLPPGSGLSLRFGAATMEPNVEYRYRIPGYLDGWSEWSADPVLNIRSLPAGEHAFELDARIRGGRAATPLRYPLRVQPYWYERGWVRALFLLAGLLAVAGIAMAVARWRNRQVIAHNRNLAQKVRERTAELEEANRQLAEQASRDGLTGVANRRALEQALQREWQRCGEHGEPLAVAMLDVDHFKRFNDAHGHQEGDAQLRRLAQALAAETCTPRELAARYGGEEFALVLPGLTAAQAAERADRVRRRFAQAATDAGFPGTASLGVASLSPVAGTDSADLVKRADEALYRAKRNGRDRVEIAC